MCGCVLDLQLWQRQRAARSWRLLIRWAPWCGLPADVQACNGTGQPALRLALPDTLRCMHLHASRHASRHARRCSIPARLQYDVGPTELRL